MSEFAPLRPGLDDYSHHRRLTGEAFRVFVCMISRARRSGPFAETVEVRAKEWQERLGLGRGQWERAISCLLREGYVQLIRRGNIAAPTLYRVPKLLKPGEEPRQEPATVQELAPAPLSPRQRGQKQRASQRAGVGRVAASAGITMGTTDPLPTPLTMPLPTPLATPAWAEGSALVVNARVGETDDTDQTDCLAAKQRRSAEIPDAGDNPAAASPADAGGAQRRGGIMSIGEVVDAAARRSRKPSCERCAAQERAGAGGPACDQVRRAFDAHASTARFPDPFVHDLVHLGLAERSRLPWLLRFVPAFQSHRRKAPPTPYHFALDAIRALRGALELDVEKQGWAANGSGVVRDPKHPAVQQWIEDQIGPMRAVASIWNRPAERRVAGGQS